MQVIINVYGADEHPQPEPGHPVEELVGEPAGHGETVYHDGDLHEYVHHDSGEPVTAPDDDLKDLPE